MNADISVIVPVYNVEKYLRRCVDSILEQSFTDFECILVDDGSTDQSKDICDAYERMDKRVTVVHQQNGGTTLARYSGLKKARAGFILFVDGDDWLECDALGMLYNKQRETGADIVLGGIRDIYPFIRRNYLYPELNDASSPLLYCLLHRFGPFHAKLYKKELFLNLVIPGSEITVDEDSCINIQIFTKITREKVQTINTIAYNYDHRTNGVMMKNKTTVNYAYHNHPRIRHIDWLEKNIPELDGDESIQGAFLLKKLKATAEYLRFNKSITKQDVEYFYRDLYKKCPYRKRMYMPLRMLYPLFYHSIVLGKCYSFLLNLFAKLI